MKTSDVKPKAEKKKYYKVLSPVSYDNKILTGGYSSFNYSPYLPSKDGKVPGKWLTIPANKRLSMCSVGFHVTTRPQQWGSQKPGARVFLVEVVGRYLSDGSKKVCCRKIRLVEEAFYSSLTQEWGPKKMYTGEEVKKILDGLEQKFKNLVGNAVAEAYTALGQVKSDK